MKEKLKEKVKSKITIKFNGVCQNCKVFGTLKKYCGIYWRAYHPIDVHWRFKTPIPFEIHHILPISKGGNHKEKNLTLLCKKCHRSIIHPTLNLK